VKTQFALAAVSTIAALACTRCAAQPHAAEPTRRALIVACTAYENLPRYRQLEGPANDVPIVRDLLVNKYHFPNENIAVLAESPGDTHRPTGEHIRAGSLVVSKPGDAHRPTREHIRAAFDDLKNASGPGDYVVILLSGHGCQQPAAPEDRTELDGLDELFLPADAGPWDPKRKVVNNAIVDNELGDWVRAIQAKGASVWLIVDACCSGTMIRGTDEEIPRLVPVAEMVPKDILSAAYRAAAELRRQHPAAVIPDQLETGELKKGVVALYAAQPEENTYEKKLPGSTSAYHGLLTYTLCEVLDEPHGPMTYGQLVRNIYRKYVASGRMGGPMPMVEGPDIGRLVLGDATPAPPAPLILAHDADGWGVDGGELHGLTVGTVLEVSAPADAAGAGGVVGHVKVLKDGFGPLRARVEPCQYLDKPANAQLPAGGTCRAVYVRYGDLRVKVAADRYVGVELSRGGEMPSRTLPETARAQLVDILKGFERADNLPFQLVERPQGAEWLVRAADEQARQVYLLPTLGFTSSTVPHMLGPVSAEPAVLEDILRRIARFQRLKEVVGKVQVQSQTNTKDMDVELELRRLKSPDDEEGTPLLTQTARPDLRDGDLVGFLVTNKGRLKADVTLLFLDSNFGIEPFFPNAPGTFNRLKHDEKLLRRARINASTIGDEHVALIAVEAEGDPLCTDFTFLCQPTIDRARGEGRARGADAPRGFDSPLGELIQSSLYAQGSSRGIETVKVKNYSTRLVSWRTLPRGNASK
jgi:hypothetical protein